jgi:hypothetical protein
MFNRHGCKELGPTPYRKLGFHLKLDSFRSPEGKKPVVSIIFSD